MNQPDVTSKDRFLSSRQRYQEIVNKASCLSLVSNAILYWDTIKIAETVGRLRAQVSVTMVYPPPRWLIHQGISPTPSPG